VKTTQFIDEYDMKEVRWCFKMVGNDYLYIEMVRMLYNKRIMTRVKYTSFTSHRTLSGKFGLE